MKSKLLAGIIACLFVGCAILGIESKSWHVDPWTKNVRLTVNNKPGDVLSFDVPREDGVHSIDKGARLKVSGTVSMTYEITGTNPVFWSTEDEPGQVGFKFASATMFSNHAHRQDLRLGKHTLAVPMTPDAWQTIDGIPCDSSPGQIRVFNKAVEGDTDISICFGGTNHGYAHGVYLKSGSAKFRVTSFSP
jgi:hypothetical protein